MIIIPIWPQRYSLASFNPTKEHPTPYFVQWFDPSNKVIASRQTLISFLIRPYNGEVLCDIVPINTCHLLLDRPPLFDNYV